MVGEHPGRVEPAALGRVAARVRELAESYEPPAFAEAPHTDAVLFLCAIDHRTGYRGDYLVDAKGPFGGSDLLWHLGLLAESRHPGALSAPSLEGIDGDRLGEMFAVGGETLAGADERAALWRDLAAGLIRDYDGEAESLLRACDGRLAGGGGLLERLGAFAAYADPLAKKSFLFAKIAARRGWLQVSDPESWEVCADNVLMRLALRSGLVHPGEAEEVRGATRAAFKAVAGEAGIEPPVLDDLLWELGRNDPDLLGDNAGDISEPQRPAGTLWY